jgi:hypothetical protein
MRGRSDQQIGESASRLSPFVHHGSHDESVAAHGSTVERDRLESGFNLLQPGLALGRLDRRGGQ